MLPLLDEPPDLSNAEYTIILPHDVACELIAGRVPRDVIEACISAIKALQETPAEGLASMKRRRKARTEAA